jgi:hypothetical protein
MLKQFAVFVLIAVTLVPVASAQTPPLPLCANFPPAQGGEMIPPPGAGYQVTLPSPGQYRWFTIPDSGLVVCHVESGSVVRFDFRTGRESSRQVGSPDGALVLDAIVASYRLTSPRMAPPATGDAGLASAARKGG